MSQEQPMQASAVAPRRQIPIRFDQLKRAPGLMVIGLPELIGLIGAVLLALITLFAYFYFYLPAQFRLRSTQKEAEQLQAQLRTSQKLYSDTTSTSEAVDRMTGSVKEFESSRLAASASGRLSLYTELNNLIRSNGLRNTAGPSYTPLEAVGVKAQGQQVATAQKQGIAKWQSIYPGIAVSVTVEGQYQSVRHFVHDIEASRHFLIINAVELEGATQSGATQDLQPPVTAPKPLGVTPRTGGARAGVTPPPVVVAPAGGRGSLVSLRLDMATYFQRSDARNQTAPPK